MGRRTLSEMVITVEDGTVRVSGTIDLSTAARLTREAEAARTDQQHVVLDLGDVEFVDSIGLRELIRMERGGGVTLLNPPERVMQLLDLTGTTELFAVQHRRAGARAVSETQLHACLSALVGALDAEPGCAAGQLLWKATEALAGSGVDDLIGVLWTIEKLGYLVLETDSDGAVARVAVTEEGRQYLRR